MREKIKKIVKPLLVVIIAGFIVSTLYVSLANRDIGKAPKKGVKLPEISGYDYPNLENRIDDLESKVEDLESKVEEVESKTDDNEANISDNESSISDLEDQIQRLKWDIDDLESRISDLEWETGY